MCAPSAEERGVDVYVAIVEGLACVATLLTVSSLPGASQRMSTSVTGTDLPSNNTTNPSRARRITHCKQLPWDAGCYNSL
jgi:hypothetical protein